MNTRIDNTYLQAAPKEIMYDDHNDGADTSDYTALLARQSMHGTTSVRSSKDDLPFL
jgi:hypothetical protein